ncbi:spore germination protein GerPC [Paenibacillus sp. GCM10027626]|uniref:spore germination protein GerPC n=1 Tax=Paenibacillus sp. GCM10027626 TaxID=3273411 RepID=UPI0036408582
MHQQQYINYMHMIEQRMRQLEEKQQLLEKENEKLNNQLLQIKPVHIENINYKVQELTVKELSGTLNIGLTALADQEQLKKWFTDPGQGEEIQFQDLDTTQAGQKTNE